jgi:ABC-type Zn uptake system ZnuABC Zn-binding protein ZnuA
MKTLITLLLFICFNLSAEKLKVCVTVPDLAQIVKVVGGDQVTVSTLVLPSENPHAPEIRGNEIQKLKDAELFIINGFALEALWLPKLLAASANARIVDGEVGFLDPSSIIKPIVMNRGTFTRLSGRGEVKVNPHYLLDPVNSLKVSRLICSRLKVLRPKMSESFNASLYKFQKEILVQLVGSEAAGKLNSKQLSRLIKIGQLEKKLSLLVSESDNGWLGKMKKLRSRKFTVGHDYYAYFFQRFGLVKAGSMEALPGLKLDGNYLSKLAKSLIQQKSQGIIFSGSVSISAVESVSMKAQLPIIKLAHQTAALKESEIYLKMIDYNVNEFLKVSDK